MNPMSQMNQMSQFPPGIPQANLQGIKKIRWFVALYDYDPMKMSPNPDVCEEELPFFENDNIKVFYYSTFFTHFCSSSSKSVIPDLSIKNISPLTVFI